MNTKTINHPSGVKLKTPLLIPSFSSKGFLFEKDDGGNIKSEICQAIKIAREYLVESLLVSAYDIHNEFLLNPSDFVSTEITFIDSGGYEISNNYDLSETRRNNVTSNEWKLEHLESVINNWPKERFPAVIINYDNEKERKSISSQIDSAISFFNKYPNTLSDFLIKPESIDENFVDIDKVFPHISKLKKFNIIGVTEKELGSSILDRMLKISFLREKLDEEKIDAPIHIFGSLDPITTILYFLAGAEIFDGLTWVKYSYHQGIAMYTNNLSVLDNKIEINQNDDQIKAFSITNNILYLNKLKNVLIKFKNSNEDFNIFNDLGYNDLGSLIKDNYTLFNNHKKQSLWEVQEVS